MSVLLHPLATEKAINMIEKSNIITYIVNIGAKKEEIKREFENTFKVKVDRINTSIEMRNRKKAYIKLGRQFKASDLALRLKLV